MDNSRNPYAPGAGRRPVALAGRDPEIANWQTSLSRIENGLDAVPLVLYGLRGVGKTVLLGEMARRAVDRGWVVVKFEAGPSSDLRSSLAARLYTALADAKQPKPGA
ncbi:MAG: ATP-binding protein, partial [Demequina sp.]